MGDGIRRVKFVACFEWSCPDCERYNISHGTKATCPFEPGEGREEMIVLGVVDAEHPDDGWIELPSRVVCPGCKGEFRPWTDEEPGDDEGDEDEDE